MWAWLTLISGVVFFAPLAVSIAVPPYPNAEPDSSPTIAAIAGGVFLVVSVILWREPPLPDIEDESFQ